MAKKIKIENSGIGVENITTYGKKLISIEDLCTIYYFDNRIKFFLFKKYGDEKLEQSEWEAILKKEKITLNKIS